MKNLSELKKLEEGQQLTLVNSYDKPHKNIGIKRKIIKKQTNAIKFEGGSWLYFPKASKFRGTERGFIILEDVPIKDNNNQQIWDEESNNIKRKTVEFLEYELD